MSTGGLSTAPRPTPISSPKGIPGTGATSSPVRSKDEPVLENQLMKSRSPYVRAHASNPVHWQIWSPETLELSKKHNRILFVSIGYSACHWCHVMERESFENEEVAKILNDNFIPIKVDREERPDIDRIYLNYVQATTGSGGWPLNVFLTPDLEPIFGGTYWAGPNAVGSTKESLAFTEVLYKMVQTWREQQPKVLASAKEIMPKLKEFTDEGLKGTGEGPDEHLEVDLLEEAYQQFITRFDPIYGGFGLPPKFPVPVKLGFLLRLESFPTTIKDIVGERECENAKAMVIKTLKHMTKGGVRDHIGHGFSRYSVTADWSLPHFEKMLYDNAQLLSLYLDAWLVSDDPEMLETAIDIATYLCDDNLSNPEGGFFSSEGADSLYRAADTDKREGAFYVWTRREFDVILGAQESSVCAKHWNVHREGNVNPEDDAHDEFIHQNVLSVATPVDQLSTMYGISSDRIEGIIKDARGGLLKHRNKERPRPSVDDKIVTSWNGLAIGALSRASSLLEEKDQEMARKCRDSAIRATAFIKKNLYDEKTGLLKRVYREGAGDTPGFADDYAYLIAALIQLYEATFDASYLKWAEELQRKQIELFWDKKLGGFFSTQQDAYDMILRLKDGLDSQEPSTNGVSAENLYRLTAIFGDDEYGKYARKTCGAFAAEILEHPSMFASLMSSIVASNLGTRSIVFVGKETDPEIKAKLAETTSRLLTNTSIVWLRPGDNDEAAKWLLGRNKVFGEAVKKVENDGGKPFVQVCEGTTCLNVFNLSVLDKALKDAI